ncbi:MAG TPA: hypothetical protein VIU61_01525 [Kofleriaceae bacterium]
MLTRILPLVAALGLAGACTTTTTIDPDPIPDATLTVVNQSDYAVTELYLTSSVDIGWGSNVLRGDVLFPAEQISLAVSCDVYDALLVDEDGVECQLDDIDLCLNDATWIIRNNTCSVFGAKEDTQNRVRE